MSGTAALRLDSYLPYRLSVAANAVSGLIARAYRDRFGLAVPQWRVICVLAEDGPSTQNQIVARTVMDKVTVSRAVQGLAARRLVARSEHRADRRSHFLALTDLGRRMFADIAPLALEYETALLAGMDIAEVARLKQMLARLQMAAESLASP